MAAAPPPPTTPPGLVNVREVIAIHSAKGGVGKSTIAANLAVALAKLGLNVALLDADIHGPSIAHMFGSSERPEVVPGKNMARPLLRHGVSYLSLANVATDDAPIIWRGPMVSGALQQLLTQVDWGDQDVLLIDMPPGTGDAVLSVGQGLSLTGVVGVTTPQELSLADTRRGLEAFAKLQVPVLGVLENMAGFACDECGEVAFPFGRNGGEEATRELGLEFLGRLPLDPSIGVAADSGRPAAGDDEHASAPAFASIARALLARMAEQGRGGDGGFDVTWAENVTPDLGADVTEREGAGDPALPVKVWQAGDDLLAIRWADGRRTLHGAYEMRTHCPCAACHQEWTGERLPSLDDVPRDVLPVSIRSVGRYALQPTWSDGHRTGIFTFRDLRDGLGLRSA